MAPLRDKEAANSTPLQRVNLTNGVVGVKRLTNTDARVLKKINTKKDLYLFNTFERIINRCNKNEYSINLERQCRVNNRIPPLILELLDHIEEVIWFLSTNKILFPQTENKVQLKRCRQLEKKLCQLKTNYNKKMTDGQLNDIETHKTKIEALQKELLTLKKGIDD